MREMKNKQRNVSFEEFPMIPPQKTSALCVWVGHFFLGNTWGMPHLQGSGSARGGT